MTTNVQKIFSFIDTYAESKEMLYLEAAIEACERWLDDPSKLLLTDPISKEEIRRGIQLAILKGMKQSAQPHHQMTPDSIGMLIGHIASKLADGQQSVTVLDPAAGTGNLLYTVMNAMDGRISATAVEIDDLLVKLSAITSELLEQPVTFFIQDALRPLLVDPVDMTVSDLPVGFYPDDENAMDYELMPKEGHAYAHHLFIEQSMKHTKEGGFGIFIMPANLFDSDQSSVLHPYLKNKTAIRAVIQLPDSLFKNASLAKSILILQKPFSGMKQSDVLLAKVPDMTNKHAMALFLQKIDMWTEEESLKK
ncbi:class I SAM-dependent methyltransferase [Sporosarcina sp. HYO08]|uniref:class I SAM-dependent methyltransferase n=1 Tax=Sporosarcina sp. HYO08 TaxID=1759557 RepID=UPI00079621CE|nr:class I SAM-dependent methyltransferase [Sporosarcina sp. HYO08]KXH87182.1 DNA methylase [Sporosarcina sp. HYO08]